MIHILGIRHHGPGSARHLMEAFTSIEPDIVLIEGPPEGEQVLQWVADAAMKPPVALLGYVPTEPQKAVFYPFASFSPEWQAMKYGLAKKIPVRFMDMPLCHKLALEAIEENAQKSKEENTTDTTTKEETSFILQKSPLSYLAEAAGFEDAELWWEHQFEISAHPVEVFEAIAEAMHSLRENLPQRENKMEDIREAFMRKAIRTAQKEKFEKIVVVCGAWHVPALQQMPSAKEDNQILKNLPRVNIDTTWIPWTSDRLSFESGYGAGVNSPGWYHHCWQHPQDDGTIWLSHAAQVFRKNQIDISSAHIIEAVRLANSLASLRDFSKASLSELNEATQAVMCMGDEILMQIVWKDLIVGKNLGEVPEGTPQVPLQKDFEQIIKSLRLKKSSDYKDIILDLRNENDLKKSVLLHRLHLLDIDWGREMGSRGKGTFKEEWRLTWYPELSIKLLEKATWGNTVEDAGNQYLSHLATSSQQLDQITQILQKALPAELDKGVRKIIKRMDELSAGTSDTVVLMKAFVPLVQVSRYGNVRKTDIEMINFILDSIFYRLTAGLPMSCTGIDEAQASTMVENIKEVHQAIMLLDEPELKSNWLDTLHKISDVHAVAPKIQGFCYKTMYDAQDLDKETTAQIFSQALSTSQEPAHSALWLEGFLEDAASTLLIDEVIWEIVNEWVKQLQEETFVQVVPLLRRTFSTYSTPEKQKIAEKVKQGKSSILKVKQSTEIDHERAEKVLPILEKMFGI